MFKIEIKSWLARENGVGKVIEGEIKAETDKAFLFKGHSSVEKRTHCNRCGRELTHPSSKIIGFGPTCCEKIGVEWPDKSELSEEEIESVKNEIINKHVEFWLPKSQIISKEKIEGSLREKPKTAVIGMDARRLKDGTIKKKGVAIKSPYEHKDLCNKVKDKFGGRWKPKKKVWSFPMQVEVVDYAEKIWKQYDKKIEKSKLLKEWYENEKNRRQQLIATKAKENVEPSELKTILADTLYDFQRVGTDFLSKTKGAILADDMGLGKTIQSIATVDNIGAKKVLVICPASLKLNWENEIEKWLPNTKTSVISGTKEKKLEKLKKDARFYIINYASIREKSRAKIDGKWTKIDNPIFKKLHSQKWGAVIFDEAHRIKNRKSQQTKAAHKLIKKGERVYHLTGTPIMNSPEEIWSLLHSLDSQKFSSFWRFVNTHCEVWDNGFGKEIGGAKNPKEFRELLKPYMLRRVKEEVVEDMPDLTINQRWVELEDKQQKIYDQMEKRMVAEFSEGETVAAPIIISKIMRLKQISVSPQLIDQKKEYKSAKINALFDIIDGAGEQKVVVFTQYQEAAKLVANKLEKQGIGYGMIHGGVDQDKRQGEVDRFQNDPNCKVFVATIKAGGLGITLTAGSIAVFLDKDWTPANNNQAIDRLHRIGQESNVTVVELLAKNTIEEYIEKMLEDKQETFDTLIEGKVNGKEILLNLMGGERSENNQR